MSEWCVVVALKSFFIITSLAYYLTAEDVQKLPYCNPEAVAIGAATNDYVIVSTLDGRLTAFATESGAKAWDIETQPLLSSNLHHVELNSFGKSVRLVPSLRGTLYSLQGDTMEALPLDAEQLLSSSFKYSDNLVIAGARETQWTGVDARTGGILYECGSLGCNGERTSGASSETLVLRRNSNTVRALEPRNGNEKWNFSVAEHQLELITNPECLGQMGPVHIEYEVAVMVPDGVIAVHHPTTSHMLWTQKLEAPVTNMWRLRAGSLQNIDVLWASTKSLSTEQFFKNTPPSLYIGLHNQQLYVQESMLLLKQTETALSSKPVPWKLKQVLPLISGPSTGLTVQNDKKTLSIINSNTAVSENQGFFLYSEQTCDQAVQTTEPYKDEEPTFKPDSPEDQYNHHHVHVHVYSLWYWWKEVILIAVSSALLMNLMIWPRFVAPRIRPPTPLPINQEYIVVERHYDRPQITQEYSGRYDNDFTPLRCLGRGGFGVVFEAMNNIDQCSYAVKRITLPRRESKRERVLREVRALAKLEHENIVRYFNAWLEEPPPNWQEQRDAVWMRELDTTSHKHFDTNLSTQQTIDTKSRDVTVDMQKRWRIDAAIDAMEYSKHFSEPSKRHRSLSCTDSYSMVDEDTKNLGKTHEHSISMPYTPADKQTDGRQQTEADDDSFIVFGDENHNSKGVSEARAITPNMLNNGDKSLSKTSSIKKKKGHTRHWSLDLCVREQPSVIGGSKMYLYIQMQLCLKDSLHAWLRSDVNRLNRIDKVKNLFSQIVSAVEYVHLAGLIHRDLKPSNIFFAPDGRVKVGDFGLVTTMGDSQDSEEVDTFDAKTRHTYRVGTHLYMSPEQLSGRRYSYKVDIYSLGLILFELLQPFGTESERVNCLLGIRQGKYPDSFQMTYPREMEVLQLMLSAEPHTRPTASGVRARAPLYHPTDTSWHFTLPQTVVNC